MTTQLPPASIEAEEAILGAILFDPSIIMDLPKTLPVAAFYVGAHQTIYQSMLDCFNSGHDPDLIALSTYLEGKDILDRIGGTTKLAQLLNRTVSSLNTDRYAKLVLEMYRRRQLIAIGYQIVDLSYDKTVELSQLYEQIKELLPGEVIGNSEVTTKPIITKAIYTVISKSGQKKIDLEAHVKDDWNLANSIASVAAKAKLIAESLWGEDIE